MKVIYDSPAEGADQRSINKLTLEAESLLEERLLYNLVQLLARPLGKGTLDAAIDALLP